jgi:hypothetical protein
VDLRDMDWGEALHSFELDDDEPVLQQVTARFTQLCPL